MAALGRVRHVVAPLPRRQEAFPKARPRADGGDGRALLGGHVLWCVVVEGGGGDAVDHMNPGESTTRSNGWKDECLRVQYIYIVKGRNGLGVVTFCPSPTWRTRTSLVFLRSTVRSP